MKAITVRQPWASLIAAGVKTIETRPRRTAYRGRIAIHAGAKWTLNQFVELCHTPSAPAIADALIADGRIEPHTEGRRKGPYPGDVWYATTELVHDLPLGAVVASAVLIDCVPIIAGPLPDDEPEPRALVVGNFRPGNPNDLSLFHEGDPFASGHDDQAPFGDFTPGRWALLLDDIKPTTERCPSCWGSGRVDHPVPGVPRSVCEASSPCPVCWPRTPDGEREFWANGRAGRCDPVPARGQQPVPWEWTP